LERAAGGAHRRGASIPQGLFKKNGILQHFPDDKICEIPTKFSQVSARIATKIARKKAKVGEFS